MSLTAIRLFQSSEMKIFHELDAQNVQKLGIKRFWAQKAEMILTANQLFRISEMKSFHEHDVHHV